MTESQLTCFLAVAECLNFARAAEQLHVTQPAVTQQIHSLERELNVRLFRRSTRSVSLTEAGCLFLEDARGIVALAARARHRFESPHGPEAIQSLAIGCYSYGQLFTLVPALRRLAERYPALRPRLRVVPFQFLYRLLEDDDVDAIIAFREPDSKKITAAYREVARVPLVCVCPAGSPLAVREQAGLEDLREEKLVMLDPARAQADVARLQGQLMEGRRLSDLYFADAAEGATILVAAGLGVSILPDLSIPPDLPLVKVPIRDMEPVSFGVYCRSERQSAPLKDLTYFLRETAAAGREAAAP